MLLIQLKPLSRTQSLCESRGGYRVAKPIFSNSTKRYRKKNSKRKRRFIIPLVFHNTTEVHRLLEDRLLPKTSVE